MIESDTSQRGQHVAVARGAGNYPATPPFAPDTSYPECPVQTENANGPPNQAYSLFRESLHLLGLDGDRYGQAAWNPLGKVIRPGETVVLKPNLVRDFRETHAGDGDCLITHGAVLRAALDYAYIALAGKGRLIIADAPQNDADFDAIAEIAGLREIQAFYRRQLGFEVEVYDLRPEVAEKIDGVIVGHKALPGDPAGYAKVDLGADSAFVEVRDLCHLLYGAEYDTREIRSHHHDQLHEYLISKTILGADCVLSLPKLKTHKKTGLTVNMKNLVGINGNKNWLPHHREGTPSQGGDQFADDRFIRRVERKATAAFKRLFPLLGPFRSIIAGPAKALGKRAFGDTNTTAIRSGNWYGNDTTWRMVLDLNRILRYADQDGVMRDARQRKVFSIVDGIVAGEGNGPLDATAKPAGVLLAGADPIAVDLTCARLMGFDYKRIPLLARAMDTHPRPLTTHAPEQLIVASNDETLNHPLSQLRGSLLNFRPHFGWTGHIEVMDQAS